MPIVFGGATLVSVFIGLWQKRELFSAHPLQYLGTLVVIVGVILVQAFSSHSPPTSAGNSASASMIEPSPRSD
jgi:hypothetical protein